MKGGPAVCGAPVNQRCVGGVLLSHTLAGAVPSALEGFASGFGMGPGVDPSAEATDTNTRQIISSDTGSHTILRLCSCLASPAPGPVSGVARA